MKHQDVEIEHQETISQNYYSLRKKNIFGAMSSMEEFGVGLTNIIFGILNIVKTTTDNKNLNSGLAGVSFVTAVSYGALLVKGQKDIDLDFGPKNWLYLASIFIYINIGLIYTKLRLVEDFAKNKNTIKNISITSGFLFMIIGVLLFIFNKSIGLTAAGIFFSMSFFITGVIALFEVFNKTPPPPTPNNVRLFPMALFGISASLYMFNIFRDWKSLPNDIILIYLYLFFICIQLASIQHQLGVKMTKSAKIVESMAAIATGIIYMLSAGNKRNELNKWYKDNKKNEGNKGNKGNKGNEGNEGNKGNEGNEGNKGNEGDELYQPHITRQGDRWMYTHKLENEGNEGNEGNFSYHPYLIRKGDRFIRRGDRWLYAPPPKAQYK